ncbi:TfoX/Sxy family protein [Anaeromyxobacter diazotrophicus]|nr:TfoX/Sxy family protein [Anaeromyxobacter diazotrophicus]
MATRPSVVEYAVELLGSVGPVQARAMFSGHGIYAEGVMFALLYRDELYLKADDVSRPRFVEAGCQPWVYESRTRVMTTSYYRPPDDAHESAEAMLPWARLALDAALRARAAKAKAKPKPSSKAKEKEKPARPGAGVARRPTRAAPRARGSTRATRRPR